MSQNNEQLESIRHSICHLMSMAVLEIYPKAGLGVGPFIDDGFYQDYDLPESISEEILPKLEKRVQEMIKEKIDFVQHGVDFESALAEYKHDPYKTEMILDLKEKGEKDVSFYKSGSFENLCKGPHVANTSEIDPTAFKLTKIAGAYWRGDEKNKMLTRIYGVAFGSKKELDDYLHMMEEAEKRDHRKLGKELDLFVFSDLIGQGMPIYTPRGAVVRREIINFSNELQKTIGYSEVHSPQVNKADLFKKSGHYDKFKDDMMLVHSHYSDEEFFLKPMNCPQHTQLFASRTRSYRDLPIRYADFANLFRDEKPGELSGLTRLRCFSQDDGHSFCREDQIEEEFQNVLSIIQQALGVYGLTYYIRLSLWDENEKEKYLGDAEVWEKSQSLLEGLLTKNNIKYETAKGEAAFYGPKMDVIAKDAIGRDWQISTIQLDFNMPVRFDLVYKDKDGEDKHPVMVHRAIVGSPERFMAILIEHYAGAFPVWLSPVQVSFLPVSTDKHLEGTKKLAQEFKDAGIRVEVDEADETVGNKIRKASKQKIPYIIVVGDKELGGEDLMIRVRGQEEQEKIGKEEFIERVRKEIGERLK
ncbi:threonine--tRNA ligase [Patescibacteria group bacterium]|nr:threonine--tRNA ligase [Patescibacteria group bacterium]